MGQRYDIARRKQPGGAAVVIPGAMRSIEGGISRHNTEIPGSR